ncbi:MAG: c-type cytochrome [Pseudomonadota bacterium]
MSEAELATPQAVSEFQVSAEILALVGDVEYGEYLASECTTCHQADGGNTGIPSIVGWDTAPFVSAMHAYKEKHRENPVMQMITSRLANDEIAALAAYFKDLEH